MTLPPDVAVLRLFVRYGIAPLRQSHPPYTPAIVALPDRWQRESERLAKVRRLSQADIEVRRKWYVAAVERRITDEAAHLARTGTWQPDLAAWVALGIRKAIETREPGFAPPDDTASPGAEADFIIDSRMLELLSEGAERTQLQAARIVESELRKDAGYQASRPTYKPARAASIVTGFSARSRDRRRRLAVSRYRQYLFDKRANEQWNLHQDGRQWGGIVDDAAAYADGEIENINKGKASLPRDFVDTISYADELELLRQPSIVRLLEVHLRHGQRMVDAAISISLTSENRDK